jgi:hypothetical protein
MSVGSRARAVLGVDDKKVTRLKAATRRAG